MNWNAVPGAKGRCKIFIDKWTNDRGEEFQSNKIKKFYEPQVNSAPTFQAGKF